MTAQEPELSPKQQLAVVALLEKTTIKAAAEEVSVSESTLRRWMKDQAFASVYRHAQRALFDHAMGHVQGATAEAAKTLRDIMTDTAAPETARVTAARTVLDFARHHIGFQDMVERLAVIEQTMGARIAELEERDTKRRGHRK